MSTKTLNWKIEGDKYVTKYYGALSRGSHSG